MTRKEKRNLKERCEKCKWYDQKKNECDHCAFGYPYYDYNGLKPHEVKNCQVFRDKSFKLI